MFTSSPGLIAGFHVLHRLLTPRHPPHALVRLIVPTSGRSPATESGEASGKQQIVIGQQDLSSPKQDTTTRSTFSTRRENRTSKLLQSSTRFDSAHALTCINQSSCICTCQRATCDAPPIGQYDALPLPVITHRQADTATDKGSGILHPPPHMSTHLRSDNRNYTHRADPKSLVLSEARILRPMRWLPNSNSPLCCVNETCPTQGPKRQPAGRHPQTLVNTRPTVAADCSATRAAGFGRASAGAGPACGLSGQCRHAKHAEATGCYRPWMNRG